jgi:hypothetical protein
MTGREKMEAAFSAEGAPSFPAATCYHGIFLRDHWEEVTDCPWWCQNDPDPETAVQPWIDLVQKTGEDWFSCRLGHSNEQRRRLKLEAHDNNVSLVNGITGERVTLHRPPIGGDQTAAENEHNAPADGVGDADGLDRVLESYLAPARDPLLPDFSDEGCLDLPQRLIEEFGRSKFPFVSLSSPYWRCYGLWGFEGMMVGLFEFPELIEHACRRFLQDSARRVERGAACGAAGVWIEECMTDLISVEQYRRFCLPYLRELTDVIAGKGMKSVYYFCGNPGARWDLLMDAGADALSLEEGKKGFSIDIEEVAEIIDGRMTLLGNIDVVDVLERGSEDQLRNEILRQVEGGRRNKRRFIVSLGSPVTPATPLSRVRRYCDIVHELLEE